MDGRWMGVDVCVAAGWREEALLDRDMALWAVDLNEVPLLCTQTQCAWWHIGYV